jgi:hypothetical protein
MSKIGCSRCRSEEYIPTHQFVKFDEKINYLCQECWALFRNFYFRGPKAVYSENMKEQADY